MRFRRRGQARHLRQSAGAVQQYGRARLVAPGREGPPPTVLSRRLPGTDPFAEEPSSYATTYRDARLVVLEPVEERRRFCSPTCSSYSNRRRLARHAYQHTRATVDARRCARQSSLTMASKLNLHALRDPASPFAADRTPRFSRWHWRRDVAPPPVRWTILNSRWSSTAEQSTLQRKRRPHWA